MAEGGQNPEDAVVSVVLERRVGRDCRALIAAFKDSGLESLEENTL